MRRRTFIAGAGAGVAAAGSTWAHEFGTPAPQHRASQGPAAHALDGVPSFCSHEHWGSIEAIGSWPEGFRADIECGAQPKRATDIFDLLLDPYFRGQLRAAGDDPERLPRPKGISSFRAWASHAPQNAFTALGPLLERHIATGMFQSIRLGVQTLYTEDLADWRQIDLPRLNQAVAEHYARLFDWYDEARQQAHFSEVIRPVHPEFYWRDATGDSAAHERARYRTVMRIDPLLQLWPETCPRRDTLARFTGIEPRDAASWRTFLARLMDAAAAHGAVGIKQLQAYGRSLDFEPRADTAVRWRGALSPGEVRAFEDWVIHACCEWADAHGWPHQIHVGTHNLPHSSPLPLAAIAERYPRMNLVLLHTWPFIDEGGWLARHFPNVYLDTCWLPILNPAFYRAALATWLGYVPPHKITCGHDATSIEMAVGSAQVVRAILADILGTYTRDNHLSARLAARWAADLMHNNATRLYGVGTSV